MQNGEKDLARPRPTGVRQDEQVPRSGQGPSAATAPDKTTHTPAPWHVDNCGRDVRAGEIGGLFVARIYAIPHEDNPSGYGDEQLANARLIAAAPGLLEACRVAEEVLDGALSTPARMAALRALQDAIAKAEGR